MASLNEYPICFSESKVIFSELLQPQSAHIRVKWCILWANSAPICLCLSQKLYSLSYFSPIFLLHLAYWQCLSLVTKTCMNTQIWDRVWYSSVNFSQMSNPLFINTDWPICCWLDIKSISPDSLIWKASKLTLLFQCTIMVFVINKTNLFIKFYEWSFQY